ncbi:hypothetical protein EDB86DRAFT_169289 [Lactarius hatsudake]|nr:hypothetical protein EDB86DRAFT_169289 [Lactarius hatsudake]
MLEYPAPPVSFPEPNVPGSGPGCGLSGYTADHSMYSQRSRTAALWPAYISPRAPVSLVEQPWQEDYRAAGRTRSPPYATAELQPSPIGTIRTTGGRVSSQSHSPNPTSSTSNIHQTRYNIPRCKCPRCDKPAVFDQHINEQREFCEEHIKCVISVGLATCCSVCREMPARLDSEFCSESCSNVNARRVTSLDPLDYRLRIQPERSDVPESLPSTCQECRGFMKEGRGRYCSKACEDASRKPRTSRPSPW